MRDNKIDRLARSIRDKDSTIGLQTARHLAKQAADANAAPNRAAHAAAALVRWLGAAPDAPPLPRPGWVAATNGSAPALLLGWTTSAKHDAAVPVRASNSHLGIVVSPDDDQRRSILGTMALALLAERSPADVRIEIFDLGAPRILAHLPGSDGPVRYLSANTWADPTSASLRSASAKLPVSARHSMRTLIDGMTAELQHRGASVRPTAQDEQARSTDGVRPVLMPKDVYYLLDPADQVLAELPDLMTPLMDLVEAGRDHGVHLILGSSSRTGSEANLLVDRAEWAVEVDAGQGGARADLAVNSPARIQVGRNDCSGPLSFHAFSEHDCARSAEEGSTTAWTMVGTSLERTYRAAREEAAARRLAPYRKEREAREQARLSQPAAPRKELRSQAAHLGVATPVARWDALPNWAATDDAPPALVFPLGFALNRQGASTAEVIEINLAEAAAGGHGPHGTVTGSSRASRTQLLRSAALSLAARYSPDHVAFWLLDFKNGDELVRLGRLPHVARWANNLEGDPAERDREMNALVIEEVDRRRHLLQQYGAPDVVAYRREWRRELQDDARATRPALPHLVVVVEGCEDGLGAQMGNACEKVRTLLAVGRALGVHVLMSSEEGFSAQQHFTYELDVLDDADAGRDSTRGLGGPLAGGVRVSAGDVSVRRFEDDVLDHRIVFRPFDQVRTVRGLPERSLIDALTKSARRMGASARSVSAVRGDS